MARKRQVKYESLTIRQAYHKNSAEDAQLGVVLKFLRQEQAYAELEQAKERDRTHTTLADLCRTRPVECHTLNRFHAEQRENIRDVCVHIVACYMARQERNKERWLLKSRSKGPDVLPIQAPVDTPEHLQFLCQAFPEIYSFTVGYDWRYNRSSKVDIYEHSRAGHDMKCMSTRPKPVGQYNQRGPINFRFWDRDTMDTQPPGEEQPVSPQANVTAPTTPAPGQQRKTSVVHVPGRGLRKVTENRADDVEGDVTLPPIQRGRRNSMLASTRPKQPESKAPALPTLAETKPLPTLTETKPAPAVQTAKPQQHTTAIIQNSNERQMERIRKATQLLVQGIADGRILTEKERRARFERLLRPPTPTTLPRISSPTRPDVGITRRNTISLPPLAAAPVL